MAGRLAGPYLLPDLVPTLDLLCPLFTQHMPFGCDQGLAC